VFLHSAWQFRGLAGVVLLMTAIVVISGFVGRYIYTAVPRTADGLVLEQQAVDEQVRKLEAELETLIPQLPGDLRLEDLLPGLRGPLGWPQDLRATIRRLSLRRRLDPPALMTLERIVQAQVQSRDLKRSRAQLATARRLLAVWHTVHIPLGMALFVAAFVHIGAALYYATLLR
jgi:hypothetical protein